MTTTATRPAALTIGSLFTGYGGLDLGVLAALGAGRMAWCSDNDPAVATLLRARFPESPNLGDIRDIDFRAREPVEVLTAGWPCQDISAAGKRAGVQKGIRSGLFTHVVRALRELPRPPRLVVLENVAALRWKNGGLAHVLGQLAEAGFDAVWRSVRASDVGAPHRRERIFIVAWPCGHVAHPADAPGARRKQPRSGRSRDEASAGSAGESARRGGKRESHAADPDSGRSPLGGDSDRAEPTTSKSHRVRNADRRDAAAAHPAGDRRHEGLPFATRLQRRPDATVSGDAVAAQPDHSRRNGQPPQQIRHPQRRAAAGRDRHPNFDWGHYGPAIERWEQLLGRTAPHPTQPGRHGRPVLGARFVEFLMGLDDGHVTDLDLPRTAMLRILGNGVVPQQAAQATALLLTDRAELVATTQQDRRAAA